jgi:transcriptional regulator with XRE-family HTH domain
MGDPGERLATGAGVSSGMPAKPTPGGIWLREQRRALGLTGAVLGAALGVKGQTILAVECGARALTPLLRARAEASFAKELRALRMAQDQNRALLAWIPDLLRGYSAPA